MKVMKIERWFNKLHSKEFNNLTASDLRALKTAMYNFNREDIEEIVIEFLTLTELYNNGEFNEFFSTFFRRVDWKKIQILYPSLVLTKQQEQMIRELYIL